MRAALSRFADWEYATLARMHTTMESWAVGEAWCDHARTLIATVASLHATPSTVNCVAEMMDRAPQAEKEMPTARTQEMPRGTRAYADSAGNSDPSSPSSGPPPRLSAASAANSPERKDATGQRARAMVFW